VDYKLHPLNGEQMNWLEKLNSRPARRSLEQDLTDSGTARRGGASDAVGRRWTGSIRMLCPIASDGAHHSLASGRYNAPLS
jgi:hypothetical protein